ncbi:MAG: HAD family hydrolase [Gemmatimonadota bacterium]
MPESSDVRLVLVDFDDTLVDTAPRFHNARLELFRLLSEHGFQEAEVYRVHHDEIDPAMRQRFGFGPHRLEHSFRATYEALCHACGHVVDEDLAARAGLLGRSVAGAPPLLNGAIDALQRLTQALPTALYTQAGDPDYQMSCLRACGILDIIALERIIVAECKTTERFQRVLDDFEIEDPATVWMIGNSMRSDINPALEAGANAVLVEVVDPWEFDVVEPVSAAFHTAGSFATAVHFVLSRHTS